MGTYTVATDDLRNTVRSHITLAITGILALFIVALFGFQMDVYDSPYMSLFSVMWLVTFVVPILLAPLTYLCIVGDRTSGTIKYVLGLPNGRKDYFLGKFLSRFGVASVTILVSVIAGFVVAILTFANSPEIYRFAGFTFLSLLYTLSFVSLFVAISAICETRSQAMFGVFASYFLLVPFWMGVTPFMSLEAILDAISAYVVTLSETTKNTVVSLSPAVAYIGTNELIYSGVIDQHETLESAYSGGEGFYHNRWYNASVMFGWSALSLAVGYLQFRRAELG